VLWVLWFFIFSESLGGNDMIPTGSMPLYGAWFTPYTKSEGIVRMPFYHGTLAKIMTFAEQFWKPSHNPLTDYLASDVEKMWRLVQINLISMTVCQHTMPDGLAVDIVTEPKWLMLPLYSALNASMEKNTVYISSVNTHIHCDNRQFGYRGVETVYRNGIQIPSFTKQNAESWIYNTQTDTFKIEPINSLYPQLMTFYESYSPYQNILEYDGIKFDVNAAQFWKRTASEAASDIGGAMFDAMKKALGWAAPYLIIGGLSIFALWAAKEKIKKII